MRYRFTFFLLFSCILFSTAQDLISLSGKVTRENGTPVPDVFVYTHTGDTAVTNQAGEYVINNLAPNQEYVLQAFKEGGTLADWKEGLSPCDYAELRDYWKYYLHSGFYFGDYDRYTHFQHIAANVNRRIPQIPPEDHNDMQDVGIVENILFLEEDEVRPHVQQFLDSNDVWYVVPADLDTVISEGYSISYRDLIIVQASTIDINNLDFIAVKAGDITGSGELDPAYQPIFSLSNISVCNDEAIVLLTVKNFKNVKAFQFTIEWDSTVLEYPHPLLSIVPLNWRIPTNVLQTGGGGAPVFDSRFKIIWQPGYFDQYWENGLTLPDDFVVLVMRFNVIGESGDSSVIRIVDDPLEREVLIAGEQCTRAMAQYEPGGIRYSDIIPSPELETFKSATCSQTGSGGIDLTPTNGTPPFSFEWNTGSVTEDLIGVQAGIYWVTMTDANGCSIVSELINVSANEYDVNLEVEESNDPTCFDSFDGGIVTNLNNGFGQIDYSWSSGDTTARAIRLLGGRDYNVTATDANGCADTLGMFLERPPQLDLSGTIVNATRDTSANGSVSVEAEGGIPPYTFAWNTGDTTPALPNLAVGNYIVTVTDANGCSYAEAFAVSYNIPTSTDNLAKAELQVTHFPNPVTQNVHFSLQSVSKFPLDLQILDVTGREVQAVEVRSENVTLDIQHYPAGLYLYRFAQNGKHLASGRLVKKR